MNLATFCDMYKHDVNDYLIGDFLAIITDKRTRLIVWETGNLLNGHIVTGIGDRYIHTYIKLHECKRISFTEYQIVVTQKSENYGAEKIICISIDMSPSKGITYVPPHKLAASYRGLTMHVWPVNPFDLYHWGNFARFRMGLLWKPLWKIFTSEYFKPLGKDITNTILQILFRFILIDLIHEKAKTIRDGAMYWPHMEGCVISQ